MDKLTIDDMATFCKRKGFVFPTSEIYGGLAGFYDYGPLGVELKQNIKHQWWKSHVQSRTDVVGMDGSIICNPNVWVASGHVGGFGDVMVECRKCQERMRADQLVEEALDIHADGLSPEDLSKLIKENGIGCHKCKSKDIGDAKVFNLLFKTQVGPVQNDSSTAYLRGETAQVIFAAFKNIIDTSRVKLPFGIAQMGKAFRNEIAPRQFLFRLREFEQMEIEYFVHPDHSKECPFIDDVMDEQLLIYSADMQEKKKDPEFMSVKDALNKNIFSNPWHAYWLAAEKRWFTDLGAIQDHFRVRQHCKDELAHYSSDCWDLEYRFPWGWKELQGIADRSNYDLTQHMEHSKTDLSIFDEESKKKVLPEVVAEPSLGVSRTFLVFMFDAYCYDKERENIVLKLHPKLAPVKAAILPLVKKGGLAEKAQEIFKELSEHIPVVYDQSGTVGRRYARNDEQGTPFCVTIDFETLETEDVTIRDRDSTAQVRVKLSVLQDVLMKLIHGTLKFQDLAA